MENLSLNEIIKATNGRLLYPINCENVIIKSVTINSREIGNSALFVPLVGEKVDAHKFIDLAVNSGVAAVLSQKTDIPKEDVPIILVDDTKLALQKLATYYRSKFDIPVIGVSGSVGKTSTKEMIYSALSTKLNVLKTFANQNSQIGLPLTLFNLDYNHQVAVIEMGMSEFNEMSKLASIAKPTAAAITNIGISHIENLHTKENILKEKLHITDCMKTGDLIYLNGDDEMLKQIYELAGLNIKTFGLSDGVTYKAKNIRSDFSETSFDIILGDTSKKVTINAIGKHNVLNALCAIAIGVDLGIDIDSLIAGIFAYSSPSMRQEIHRLNGYTVIDDSYNASPDSMKSGIEVLTGISKSGNKILVCADMLELGEYAKRSHYDLGKTAAENGITHIITIGELAKNIALAAQSNNKDIETSMCNTNEEAYIKLIDILKKGDTVLIKGSRGMKTDEIVKKLLSE